MNPRNVIYVYYIIEGKRAGGPHRGGVGGARGAQGRGRGAPRGGGGGRRRGRAGRAYVLVVSRDLGYASKQITLVEESIEVQLAASEYTCLHFAAFSIWL